MDEALEIRPAALSRRALLQSVTAGGAVVLAGVAGTPRQAAAQAKAAKTVVAYQDQPHGDQRCDNCLQFVPPSACKVVDGTISASGWCQIWAQKPA